MKSKGERYRDLVKKREDCLICKNIQKPILINISDKNSKISWLNAYQKYDTEYLDPWSRWQRNLDSQLMVVGNDWAGTEYLEKHRDIYSKFPSDPTSITNIRIVNHVNRDIGIEMDLPSTLGTKNQIFMVNTVLCIKKGDNFAKLPDELPK